MKKRRHSVLKARHRSRIARSKVPGTITFQRIIIYAVAVALFLGLTAYTFRRPLTSSVAGLTIARSLFNQGTVSWESVSGAKAYNLYYKTQADADFTNSVIGVSPEYNYYTISYLRKGVDYDFRVSAIDASGKEFWWSGTNQITSLEPM